MATEIHIVGSLIDCAIYDENVRHYSTVSTVANWLNAVRAVNVSDSRRRILLGEIVRVCSRFRSH